MKQSPLYNFKKNYNNNFSIQSIHTYKEILILRQGPKFGFMKVI